MTTNFQQSGMPELLTARCGNATKLEWDRRVRAAIKTRVANPTYASHVLKLWQDYLTADLAHHHFVRELTKGEDGPFHDRIWEMLMGRHLLSCGYNVISPPQDGRPDFRCEKDGRITWVEITRITAGKDPVLAPTADWLCGSGYVPHDNILLRWTNAVDVKLERGKAYRLKGVIKADEAYVIAICGGELSIGNYGFGASRLPYVVEATMAVGPLQFIYDRKLLELSKVKHQMRVCILKQHRSLVSTAKFFDDSNSETSALIGCGVSHVEGDALPLLIVHNPYASIALAPGHFGVETREWVASLIQQSSNIPYWTINEVLMGPVH